MIFVNYKVWYESNPSVFANLRRAAETIGPSLSSPLFCPGLHHAPGISLAPHRNVITAR